jgi:hypothetical protein
VGYVESDNYGQHEAGFVIVQADSAEPTFGDDRDTYALDTWSAGRDEVYGNERFTAPMLAYDTITRADIQSALVIEDTDAAKGNCGVTWSLEASSHAAVADR